MKTRGMKRQMVGTVVSDKMDKTVVVLVEKLVKHSSYHKYIRKRARFTAHDEKNSCKTGDVVKIALIRPISKHKRWRVTETVSSGEGKEVAE